MVQSSLQVAPSVAISGLHCIANLQSSRFDLLSNFSAFRKFIDAETAFFQLNKLGEVYHNFQPGGYTAVVCLAESHLSIHTWPERSYLTFDVFLSNYLKDNRKTAESLYQHTIQFFEATILQENILNR
jgi:S-adenosylmethionine decarboxylase